MPYKLHIGIHVQAETNKRKFQPKPQRVEGVICPLASEMSEPQATSDILDILVSWYKLLLSMVWDFSFICKGGRRFLLLGLI